MPQNADIWRSLPVPAVVLDAQDRIDRINPAAEGFLNASERSLHLAAIGDVLTLDATLLAAFARARVNTAPLFVNEVDIGTAGRAPLSCNLQLAPLGDRPGHMILLISPRDQTGHMIRTRPARAAAKSAIGMAQMLAHEIKNPLAGISGAAQLLAMGLGPQDREMTDLIVAESRRIVALLDRVEAFGNAAAPARRGFNIHDVLDRARRSAQVGVAAGMTIVEDYDPSLPAVWGDPDQILQVVQNLLRNAAEAAGKDSGTIRLRSCYEHALRVRGRDGGEHALPVQVEIVDDGPGLPPEIAADVFDPFVSGRENGTGLGLALAAKIMLDHEGHISVRSVPGKTVFRLALPLAPRASTEVG